MFGKDDYEACSARPGSRVILAYQFRSAFINDNPGRNLTCIFRNVLPPALLL
jgi:hypothetical protein